MTDQPPRVAIEAAGAEADQAAALATLVLA